MKNHFRSQEWQSRLSNIVESPDGKSNKREEMKNEMR